MTDEAQQPLRYVLSAGRTGTVFLARLLNRQPGVLAAHEPDTSRYQMMLANLRNDWGVGGYILKTIFEAARKRRLEAAGERAYVEINPFLCPMTDLLPMDGRQLRIVHMVRDPATWVQSIMAHKASETYRGIIDYVPFGKPYPARRPPRWRELSSYERALWRWVWCNSRIDELKASSASFALVRYEDLFAEQAQLRNAALETLLDTLCLNGEFDLSDVGQRANASGANEGLADLVAVERICGPLARSYSYAY